MTALGGVPAHASVVTIPVTGHPLGLSVDEQNQTVYVATDASRVVPIDATTQTALSSISVGGFPSDTAVDANEMVPEVYVAIDIVPTNNFVVIDTQTNTVTHTMTIPSPAQYLDIAQIAQRVYVTVDNPPSNLVTVVDATTKTIIATIPVCPSISAGPGFIAVDEPLNKVFVACSGNASVEVIDMTTNTVTATIPTGAVPLGVAVDFATQKVYVTHLATNVGVKVIDANTNTVVDTIPINNPTYGVAIDQSRQKIYVANNNLSSVTIIDGPTGSIGLTIPVGSNPTGIAVDQTTHNVYVANNGSSTVSVIEIPTIMSVTPNEGPTTGGTSVTIRGTGFTGTTSVTFGGEPAATFTVESDDTITAVTPPHTAGTVDVSITTPNPDSTDTLPAGFTYVTTPAPPVPPVPPTPPLPPTGLNAGFPEFLWPSLAIFVGASTLVATHLWRGGYRSRVTAFRSRPPRL